MTFDQLKTQVKDYCGLSSTEADTRIGKSLNRHYRRVTSAVGLAGARFVSRSQTTTNGQQYVTFTEIEKIDRVLDGTDASNVRLLQEVSIHTQRSTQPHESEPTTWALRNTDADSVVILLDTVPQTTYSLVADGWTTLSDLTSSDEPVFPESFHDILAWYVIAEELLKKEKLQLAAAYEDKADSLLADLRFHLADSPTLSTRQGGSDVSTLTGSGASGSGNLGTTAYTQTALLTFDRGASTAPFAVAQATAAVVTNLDADKLDGQHGAAYLARANHTGTQSYATIDTVTTDRLLGRDTAGTGAAELLTVGGGVEFTGTGIQRSALTGDVTATAGSAATTIANDAVTYAKMQNISAAERLLGRGAGAGSGDPQEITIGAGLAFTGTALDVAAAATQTANTVYAGPASGSAAAPTFRALVAADVSFAVRVLDRDVTATTVANTTVETTVYTYSVPANTLGTDKALRLTLIGDNLNNAGADRTTTFRVKFGGTTIASLAKVNGTGTERRTVMISALISAQNATNAQRALTQVTVSADQAAGTINPTSGDYVGSTRYDTLALDSTGALTLAVTVQHSAGEATLSFIGQAAYLELVP